VKNSAPDRSQLAHEVERDPDTFRLTSISSAVPAKSLTTNGTVPAPEKHVQTDEREPASRLAYIARIERMRGELAELVDDIARANEVEVLDLMREPQGPYSRFRTASEAGDWINEGRRSLQVGLMMLDRAIHRPGGF
jgi:hypothetical protein